MLNVALKEWSATIDALASGDQIFLLRKGGIREPNRRFELPHQRFLLYPTRFHEAAKMLKPEYQHLVETEKAVGADYVTFTAWAEVADVVSIEDAARLDALSNLHIWTDEFVTKRVAWKPRHPADLIILKTYRLVNPVNVEIQPYHKGCKSWVDINPPIDMENSTYALPEETWDDRVRDIRLSISNAHAQSVTSA